MNISALARSTLMKQIAVDSSTKKLSTEALILQIGPIFACIKFLWRKFMWAWLLTVWPTILLQAPLDRARGELPSDTRTLISHWEKFRGKTGEIWRSVIASTS